MKQYNFDEIIERKGTNCVKFDNLKERFGNEHLTPLWVADMDFRTPDFIEGTQFAVCPVIAPAMDFQQKKKGTAYG